MKNILSFVLILLVLHQGQCIKILGIFPLPGRSHYILGSSLMRGLADKGHDVTVISPFSEKTPPKNGTYTDVTLFGLDKYMESKRNIFENTILYKF